MASSRWTAAAGLGLAAAMLIAAATSSRWLVAEVQSFQANGSLQIGLTSLKACVTTTLGSQCERAAWSDFPGGTDASMWMWMGRLIFAVSLAAALGLVALGGLAVTEVELRAPVPLPRIVLWMCLAILPLMIGYWLFPPRGLSALEAGRGFALGALGALAGAVTAWRQLPDD